MIVISPTEPSGRGSSRVIFCNSSFARISGRLRVIPQHAGQPSASSHSKSAPKTGELKSDCFGVVLSVDESFSGTIPDDGASQALGTLPAGSGSDKIPATTSLETASVGYSVDPEAPKDSVNRTGRRNLGVPRNGPALAGETRGNQGQVISHSEPVRSFRVMRTATAGACCVIARLRHFLSDVVGVLPRWSFPLLVHPSKKSSGSFAKCLHVLSHLVLHGLKHGASNVGIARKSFGEIQDV